MRLLFEDLRYFLCLGCMLLILLAMLRFGFMVFTEKKVKLTTLQSFSGTKCSQIDYANFRNHHLLDSLTITFFMPSLGSRSPDQSSSGQNSPSPGRKKLSFEDKTASIFGISKIKHTKSDKCKNKDLSHSKSTEICFPSKSASPKCGLFASKSFEEKLKISERPCGDTVNNEKERKTFILRSPFSCRKKHNSQGSDFDKSPNAKKKQLSNVRQGSPSQGTNQGIPVKTGTQVPRGRSTSIRSSASSGSNSSSFKCNVQPTPGATRSIQQKRVSKTDDRTNINKGNAQTPLSKTTGLNSGSRIPAPSSSRPGRSRGSGSASDSQSETDRSVRRASGIVTRSGSTKPQDNRQSRLPHDRQTDISGTKKAEWRNSGLRRSSQSDGSRSETDDSRSRSPSTTSKLPFKYRESVPKTAAKLETPTRTSSFASQVTCKKDNAIKDNASNATRTVKRDRPVSNYNLHRAQNQELFTTTIVNVTTPPSPRLLKQRHQPPTLTTFEGAEPVWQRRSNTAGKRATTTKSTTTKKAIQGSVVAVTNKVRLMGYQGTK